MKQIRKNITCQDNYYIGEFELKDNCCFLNKQIEVAFQKYIFLENFIFVS